MKKIVILTILLLLGLTTQALAFDDKITHPHITLEAFEDWDPTDDYMQNRLLLPDGKNTVILKLNPFSSERKDILTGLQDGSQKEDTPMCRASNHFHDPYLPWSDAGLSDTWWLPNLVCWVEGEYKLEDIVSNPPGLPGT